MRGARRRFAVALVLGVATGPLFARFASGADPIARIGFVLPGLSSSHLPSEEAFWRTLGKSGWVEGRNLAVERRYAQGRTDTLPAIMQDLVARNVDVIVTAGTPAALAARNTTAKIPIVVAGMGDPVGVGLAASLARPGGNVTGASVQNAEGLAGKWLELLHEIVPHLTSVAVISNPDNPLTRLLDKSLTGAALTRGLGTVFLQVRVGQDLDPAFHQARRRAQAVVVYPDPSFVHQRERIAAIAAKFRLPAIYGMSEFVGAGGLIGYGANIAEAWQKSAIYVDKILRGAKPADLPIEQPTQFTLAVNLKTAKALGLTIPESILLRADEVIR